MTIAFLFLTYDKFTANNNVINNLIKNNNLYIHPKYKDNVDENYKKYIINDIIDTKWCDISLVLATINLLKEAYKNKDKAFVEYNIAAEEGDDEAQHAMGSIMLERFKFEDAFDWFLKSEKQGNLYAVKKLYYFEYQDFERE
jgi:hypothetical protein